MIKFLFAGAAAFVLTAGVASAQSAPPAPMQGSGDNYSITQTKKAYDANGNEIDRTKTINSGSSGADSTYTKQETAPDGSQRTVTHERSTSPDGGTTTTTRTINGGGD